MSILNCQLKWSFALLVFNREKSVCKLLTPEHLEVYSIIVSADKSKTAIYSYVLVWYLPLHQTLLAATVHMLQKTYIVVDINGRPTLITVVISQPWILTVNDIPQTLQCSLK